MPDFGIFRGFNEKLFGDKLFAGQLPINLGNNFDPDATAFFQRVSDAGGTLSETEQVAILTLVSNLKDDGIWDKMKAIYPMVGASSAACSRNLKSDNFNGTFNGGWTFSSTGVTPNGTNAYLDTNLNPSLNLTQNNVSFALYSRANTDGIKCDIGCTDSSNISRLITIYARQSNVINADINSLTSRISVANTDSRGFYLTSRLANNIFKLFKNTNNIGSSTITDNSNLPNFNLYLGGIPFFSQFSDRQYAFTSIGDGLSDTESSNFYTAVQAFNTTLSRQV
jgi:hypothetical protein